MWRPTLRQRLILLISGLFLVVFVSISFILVREYTKTFRTSLNEQARSFATLATAPIGNSYILFGASGSVRVEQQINKFTALFPDITGISIAKTSGEIVYTKGSRPAHLDSAAASTFETREFTRPDGTVSEIVEPLVEDYGAHRYSIVYEVSNARITTSINQVVGAIILFSLLAFMGAIAITYYLLSRFFIRPISTIGAAARRISDGNLDTQIELRRDDELGQLAVAVNTMANSLKEDIAKLQETDRLKSEFMTITSHNLRTPLTVINGYMDEIKQMKIPKKMQGMIEAMAANVLRLDNFTEDVLTIAMIESGERAMYDLSAAPIKAFLERIASDFQPLAKQKQQRFTTDLQLNSESVLFSSPRLKNALWNLLDNAYKFTPDKGSITLAAHAENNRIIITIKDSGIGISKAEVPKLFTKFHRATGIMNYDYEGTGIGLYITKLIIQDHHGTVSIESYEGSGTMVTVWLPVADRNVAKDDVATLPKGLI
jgi:signal transduction histidine kinase